MTLQKQTWLSSLIWMLWSAQSVLAIDSRGAFELSDVCPPSFEKVADGTCALRSLYQFYNSPSGFGGLKVPLPEHRGGYTPEQIALGRLLFFDPLLSGNKDLSCAHCHHPELGFADGLRQSRGHGAKGVGLERRGGKVLPRSAPTLWNAGFMTSLFWDGRAESLESQAEGPLYSPDEMANTPVQLEASINGNVSYTALFAQAFPKLNDNRVTHVYVARALAAFQASLVSLNSRYDRYAHGDQNALTEQEKVGHTVFRSFVTRCSQCHTPPLFTNQQLAVTGAPDLPGDPFDPGAGLQNQALPLRGAFKVPTLRNIATTPPYMHSGAFDNLVEVVTFYNDARGHAVPKGENLVLHWHLVDPDLSADDADALIAFLGALTDETNKPIVPDTVPSGLPVARSSAGTLANTVTGGQ